MKRKSPLSAALLLVAAYLLFTVASNAQTSGPWKGFPDPILGRWRWFNAQFKIFRDDGTVVGPKGDKQGTWKFLKQYGEPRHYEVNWKGSLWIDQLKLVRNGTELKGKNQEGRVITAYKVPVQ